MKSINESQRERIDEENYSYKNKNNISNHIIIKVIKNFIRKNKKFIRNFIIFIIFGLTYLLYFLSLESCFEGEGPCSIRVKWIKTKIKQELISCILLAIIVQLIIVKKISKYHLIHILLVFFFFFIFIDMERILLIMDILISFFIL